MDSHIQQSECDFQQAVDALLAEAEPEFDPTFTASKHEREWILDSLGGFYDDQLIRDVLYCTKGGKEATVYCCEAHPSTGLELVAAKVYRPRKFRAMRNDAVYREGRDILDVSGKVLRDRRSKFAVKRGTRRGREMKAKSWLQHEYQTLRILHEAGSDVVKPLAASGNAILMEYVGDAGFGAPTLHEVSLERDEAQSMFERLLWNVEVFLKCDRIHADLSAYNVLYWQGDFRIIDLPQAIYPSTNLNAFFMLARDIERLCRYFARQGVEANAFDLTDGIWQRFMRGQL